MKEKNRSLIHIENCQVKSLDKAKLLCQLLDTMEKEFGIKSVRISFKNNFICPDIDLTILSESTDPMERVAGDLLIKLANMANPGSYSKKKHNGKAD